MCVVSMIGEHYSDKWNNPPYTTMIETPEQATKRELEELKKEVLEMKELLKKALKYDIETGQEDCETDAKLMTLEKVAQAVGETIKDIKLSPEVKTAQKINKCIWDKAWIGRCNEPTLGTLCDKHEGIMCACGQEAVGECSSTMSLVCGTPICKDHSFCKSHTHGGWYK